jgi:hypothetical protein
MNESMKLRAFKKGLLRGSASNGSGYPPVAGDSTQDWIRRYQEAANECARLRALLVRTLPDLRSIELTDAVRRALGV